MEQKELKELRIPVLKGSRPVFLVVLAVFAIYLILIIGMAPDGNPNDPYHGHYSKDSHYEKDNAPKHKKAEDHPGH